MICIDDLLHIDYFKNLRVIAGAKGLSNPVSGCAILDYEMDKALSQKYAIKNFRPGRLVLSSLMFAKDNPFLIGEAVKHIMSIGGSGLVIKNVYRLPIHDSVLRNADFCGFPILLMEDDMYFDTFIIKLSKYIEITEGAEAEGLELERLLHQDLSEEDKQETARRLFPLFRDQYALLYCQDPSFGERSVRDLMQEISGITFPLRAKAVLHLQRGLFLFVSDDVIPQKAIDECSAILAEHYPGSTVGISSRHFWIREIDSALKEALYAARIGTISKRLSGESAGKPMNYSDTGIYRILLPLANDDEIKKFSDMILSPVIAFDAENNSNTLMHTLVLFVHLGGSIKDVAAKTCQHINTIRYRLDKVAALTGLSYKKPDEYEQLALAVRIYLVLSV